MTTWIIVLVLIWPAIWLLRVMLVTRALMGIELRRSRATPLAPHEIPAHVQEAAQAWATQLARLDFKLLGGWRLGAATDPALSDEVVVLVHATQPVRAIVRPREESNLSGECWLSLRTTLLDGTEIATNSHTPEELVPPCEGLDVELLSTAFANELLERHLVRIGSVRDKAWNCSDIASATTREQHIVDGLLRVAAERGLVLKHEGDGYTFRLVPAMKRAVDVIRHARRAKKAAKSIRTPRAQAISDASLAAFDLQHYRQMIALTRGRFSLRAKAVITALSFIAFAGVLAWLYSPAVAITLIVALVIHEGGHLIGMWWFGFRDTQLLFIPFFGGAAIGHDDKVIPAWQHIVIILLGPLPGIFMGMALLVWSAGGGLPEWVDQVAWTTLVLNAFNLLPVTPLDGGQIVDFAVASRFPRARVVFLAASAGAMILVGLALDGAILLIGVGIAALIRLPVEWRLAGVRLEVREEFPDGGEEEPVVRRLLEALREPDWSKVPSAQRLQIVRVLQTVMRMPKPGLGTICFALAGFTAPFWFGAPLAVWALVRQGDMQIERAEQRALAAGIGGESRAALDTPIPPPEENAAIDYAEALALLGDGGYEDFYSPSDEVVNLLRTAAHKKVFVPLADTDAAGEGRLFAGLGAGELLYQLNFAAGERLRFHEDVEAMAMSADALRLLRLMQGAPNGIHWQTYLAVTNASWNNIEEALAGGAEITAPLAAELLQLSADQPVIDFAVWAVPRSMVMLNSLDSPGDDPDAAELNRAFRLLALIQRINPVWTRYRVESLDQAVALQEQLRVIQQKGVWPEVTTAADDIDLSLAHLAGLGDLLARQRQFRAALRLIELRRSGIGDAGLETLGAGPAELTHPFTREKMRLSKRGALDVLAFTSSTGGAFTDEEGDSVSELLWRVPAGPR